MLRAFAEMFCVRVLKLCVEAAKRKCGTTGEEPEPTRAPTTLKKKKKEKQAQHTDKHTSGGGVERMSVLCCITCVCITECALYTALLIQKVFPYKSPLHTIYSKILQKHLRLGFFFFFSFFHGFFFPLPE